MTDDEAREHNDTEEVIREIKRLDSLKREKTLIEAEIADIEKYLDKAVEKTVSFDDEEHGEKVVATVVRGTIDKFDEHLISTRYKRIWSSITKRVVDKQLYLNEVRSGHITPEMNARFHHEVPKKSYVKITRNKREVSE